MHNTIFLFLTTFAAYFTTLQAHDDTSALSTKVYVESSSIYLNNAGIYLVIENKLIPVEGIGRDESGLYALNPGFEAADQWICSSCKAVNNVGNRKCTGCGLWR